MELTWAQIPRLRTHRELATHKYTEHAWQRHNTHTHTQWSDNWMTGTNQKNRSLVRFQSIPHSPVNNHHLVLFNVKSSQFYLHSTKSQIFLNGLFNLHSTQHLRSSVLIRKNSPQKCFNGGKKGKKPQPNGSILKIQTSDPFFSLKFVLYPLSVCCHLSMYSLLQLFFSADPSMCRFLFYVRLGAASRSPRLVGLWFASCYVLGLNS